MPTIILADSANTAVRGGTDNHQKADGACYDSTTTHTASSNGAYEMDE
jgi:hypothetical protein